MTEQKIPDQRAPGRYDLRGQIVRSKPLGQRCHDPQVEQQPHCSCDNKPRCCLVMRKRARECKPVIKAVVHHPPDDETCPGRYSRCEVTELDEYHKDGVMSTGPDGAHEHETREALDHAAIQTFAIRWFAHALYHFSSDRHYQRGAIPGRITCDAVLARRKERSAIMRMSSTG